MFAALALARHLQDATGITIKKLVRTLRPLHTVTIDIAGHELTAHKLTAHTTPTPETSELLSRIQASPGD